LEGEVRETVGHGHGKHSAWEVSMLFVGQNTLTIEFNHHARAGHLQVSKTFVVGVGVAIKFAKDKVVFPALFRHEAITGKLASW
jgi:hypothetical protein